MSGSGSPVSSATIDRTCASRNSPARSSFSRAPGICVIPSGFRGGEDLSAEAVGSFGEEAAGGGQALVVEGAGAVGSAAGLVDELAQGSFEFDRGRLFLSGD